MSMFWVLWLCQLRLCIQHSSGDLSISIPLMGSNSDQCPQSRERVRELTVLYVSVALQALSPPKMIGDGSEILGTGLEPGGGL